MNAQPLIHVAGVIDKEEAEMLIDCGVDYLGFPLRLDYNAEDLSDAEAAAIVAELGQRATFFLITYLDRAEAIIALCEKLGVTMVQLHGDVALAELKALKEQRPGWRVIKSLVVRADNRDELVHTLEQTAPYIDAYITDTYDPETGAKGATGKTHDWAVSRELVALSEKPLILAGGLNPGNVADAMIVVRPAGVDVHTGIEGPDGRKDRDLTELFISEVRRGYWRMG